jgi:hypothetical protein
MKKIIRMTESDLTRLVKRVIKEQANEPKAVTSLKNQVVGKKVKLIMDGELNSQYKEYFNKYGDKKKGDVLTTFLIDDVIANGTSGLKFTGRDLTFLDARANASEVTDVQSFKVDSIVWPGCSDPYMFRASGFQGNYSNGRQMDGVPKPIAATMWVTNSTLSDIAFKASGCAPDIDDTEDFQP